MEARVLVSKFARASAILLLLGLAQLAFVLQGTDGLISNAVAAPSDLNKRQEIRFYKANRNLQTDRIWFTKKKGRSPGCHNFLKKTRVYKVVQFGFEECILFSQKSCAAGSEIAASHSDSEQPEVALSQGFAWLPESEHERGAKIRSWSCR